MSCAARENKRALITGIFWQDGSYLLELLHGKGYEVHGVVRQRQSANSLAIRQSLARQGIEPETHAFDLNSYTEVRNLVEVLRRDECYHLVELMVVNEMRGERD